VTARRVAGIAIPLVLLGLWFVALRPQSLGGPVTYLVIRGDSMEPGYHAGDLVVVRDAESYAIGDIVAYRVPATDVGGGHLVVHRIAGGDGQGGFRMQGDNNDSIDPWLPKSSDIVGRAWAFVPGAGRLIAFVHQPAVLGALAVALLVAAMLLRAPARQPMIGDLPTVSAGATGRASSVNPAR
jgi:signal peptidase